MTFNEMVFSVQKDIDFMNEFLERAGVFSESSYHEYEYNLAQIEVKVLTEAGTDDDKEELNKAASDGFVERTKKFISKLIETIVEHLSNIGTNISVFFNQVKVKLALKDIGEAIKDSKIANILVEIKDATKIEEFFDNAKAETLKVIAYIKAKGSDVSESTIKAFKDLMDNYEIDKHKEETRAKVKVNVKVAKKKIEDFVAKASSVTTKTASDIKSAVSNIDWKKYPAEIGELLRSAISFLTRVCKDAADNIWNGITTAFNAIKSIAGKSEKKEDLDDEKSEKEDEELKESVSNETIIEFFKEAAMETNKYYQEKVSIGTIENELKSASKECKESLKAAHKAAKEGNNRECVKNLEIAKKRLHDAIEILNSDTSGFTGAIAGQCIYLFANLGPNIIKIVNTLEPRTRNIGSDMYLKVHEIKETIINITGMFIILKKRGLTWDVFNTRKSTIIGNLKIMEKAIETEIAIYKKIKLSDSVKEAYIDPEIADEINSIFETLESPEIDDNDGDDIVTAGSYLNAMEFELFNEFEDDDYPVTESDIAQYINNLIEEEYGV